MSLEKHLTPAPHTRRSSQLRIPVSGLTTLLDCDGVLADFAGEICLGLALLGYDYTPEDFVQFNIFEILDDRAAEDAKRLMSAPGFARRLKRYEGAANLVASAKALGPAVCCTAAWKGSATWIRDRTDWLSDLMHEDDLLFVPSHHKRLFGGAVLIEDNYSTALEWAHQWNRKAILIDRPWNRVSTKSDLIVRAKDLNEAAFILPQIARVNG